MTTIDETFTWRRFQPMSREKTIVGHFLGEIDAYMTTALPGRNGCNPYIVKISDYGSFPHGGNFRCKIRSRGQRLRHKLRMVLMTVRGGKSCEVVIGHLSSEGYFLVEAIVS